MKLIASDTDLGNENQTIYFPKITTNAITDETGTSIALAGDGTSIIKDTITYENVIPGLTYRVKGRVIDRKKTLETGTEQPVCWVCVASWACPMEACGFIRG